MNFFVVLFFAAAVFAEHVDDIKDELVASEDKELPEIAKSELPCSTVQKCLNKADRACWAEFYTNNKDQSAEFQPLVNLIFNEISKDEFLAVVDQIEASHHKEFQAADETFADCMGSKGYRNYIDYCANQRPIASTTGIRVRREAGVKDEEENCWKKGLISCMNDYPFTTPKISEEMAICDQEHNITQSEIKVATTVGKAVMANVLKLKAVTDLLDVIYAENNKGKTTEETKTEGN